MLGLGSNLTKGGAGAKTIVTDSLVLKHNYSAGAVQLLSSGAASFNGSSDYINIDEGFAATNRTFTAWFNSSQNAVTGSYGNTILSQTTSTGDNRWHIRIDPADNEIKVYDGASIEVAHDSTGITIVEGQWYHVAVTNNSSSVALYINGILQKSDSFTTGNDATDVFTIGQEFDNATPSDFFKGYICNVGVWDAILTQAQVKSIMNKNYAGLSDSEKEDLVSWWNLDSVIPDTTNTVYDNHYGGGETLGTDKVTDGTFINGLASWSNSGVTESGGVVTFDADASTDYIFQNLSYTDDKVYAITLEGTGNAKIRVGYSGLAATQTVVGTLPATLNLFVDSTANRIQIYKNSGDEMLLTSVSIKEINGNTGTLS